MRDFHVNMALKLKSEKSILSPVKLRNVPSFDQNEQFFNKTNESSQQSLTKMREVQEGDDESDSLMEDYCTICYARTIAAPD